MPSRPRRSRTSGCTAVASCETDASRPSKRAISSPTCGPSPATGPGSDCDVQTVPDRMDKEEGDVFSGGRLVVGVAIGYRPDEFALYRTPLEKRGARFEEALAVIRALWTEDGVTHPGPHYPLRDARIEPKPVQRPHPPIWIGGWGEVTLRRAARLADAWLPGPTASLAKLLDGKARYQAELAAAGRPDPSEW